MTCPIWCGLHIFVPKFPGVNFQPMRQPFYIFVVHDNLQKSTAASTCKTVELLPNLIGGGSHFFVQHTVTHVQIADHEVPEPQILCLVVSRISFNELDVTDYSRAARFTCQYFTHLQVVSFCALPQPTKPSLRKCITGSYIHTNNLQVGPHCIRRPFTLSTRLAITPPLATEEEAHVVATNVQQYPNQKEMSSSRYGILTAAEPSTRAITGFTFLGIGV